VWSPDGRLIAFTSDLHQARHAHDVRTYELYTVAVDGSQVTRLTRNRVPDPKPTWQPLPAG
jgi:Tol biopolymer transport system component